MHSGCHAKKEQREKKTRATVGPVQSASDRRARVVWQHCAAADTTLSDFSSSQSTSLPEAHTKKCVESERGAQKYHTKKGPRRAMFILLEGLEPVDGKISERNFYCLINAFPFSLSVVAGTYEDIFSLCVAAFGLPKKTRLIVSVPLPRHSCWG